MKSTAKRLAAGMLAALLALSLSACEPADGTAPEDSAPEAGIVQTEGSFAFDLRDGEARLVAYTGTEGDVVVPGMLGGAPVTEIGENAFSNADSLRSVTLPDGIRTIAGRAFVHCRSLRAIELPDGVEEIGAEAFYGSGITDITIPESVKRVGPDAFYQTPYFDAQTDEFVIVGDGVLIGYNGDGGEVVLPDGVRYISRAFYRQYGRSEVPIRSVVLPEGVTEIGESAFLSIQTLESVMLPDSLRRIGQGAFCECRALKSIALPAGVTEIADRTFSGCEALERITLSESTVSIGEGAFFGCAIPFLRLPDSLRSIGAQAFRACASLETLSIPAGVREIGGWAFKGTPYFETLTDEFVSPATAYCFGITATKRRCVFRRA